MDCQNSKGRMLTEKISRWSLSQNYYEKWRYFNELHWLLMRCSNYECIDEYAYGILGSELHLICYAPHIGADAYIYRYKSILVAIYIKRGSYVGSSLMSVVSYKDCLIAKITVLLMNCSCMRKV